MTAVEVLQWLQDHYGDGEYNKVFGEDYSSVTILRGRVSAEELVRKIEKHAEPPKEVDKTSDVYRFAEWCYVNGINFAFMSTTDNPTPKRLHEIVGRYESETGTPKEEKQKIERLVKRNRELNLPRYTDLVDKINQLVDAVNELRGV